MADDLLRAAQDLEKAAQELLALPQSLVSAIQGHTAAATAAIAALNHPIGQDLLRQRAELADNQSSGRSQLETAKLRAELAYLQTPQGRAASAASRDESATQKALAQQIASEKAGPLGSTDRVGKVFGELNSAVSAVTASFNMAEGTILKFASKISPNAVATYQGSLDMVTARIGTAFLPLLEQMSAAAQRFAKELDSPTGKQALKTAGDAMSLAGSAAFADTGSGVLDRVPVLGSGVSMARKGMALGDETFGMNVKDRKYTDSWIMSAESQKKAMNWMYRVDDGGDPLKRSLEGLPQATISSGEDYANRIQMQGLQMGADSPEMDVMKQQLAALEKLNILLTDANNRGGEISQTYR